MCVGVCVCVCSVGGVPSPLVACVVEENIDTLEYQMFCDTLSTHDQFLTNGLHAKTCIRQWCILGLKPPNR